MISSFARSVSYCFDRNLALYLGITRPATPRTEPRLRTAHPGGLLVFRVSNMQRGAAA